MLREELGLALDIRSPRRAALSTFIAFLLFGLIPLVPFLGQWAMGFHAPEVFVWSAFFTFPSMFTIGALKSRFVDQHWLLAGLETLSIGGGAAALAYGVGVALKAIGVTA
jgi:VIT1/CCC1 family predicted Fe2+/Mn2+ transporter